jgi:hypothetical protein
VVPAKPVVSSEAIGKAAQLDLLSSLQQHADVPSSPAAGQQGATSDMFGTELQDWNTQKQAIMNSAGESGQIEKADLSNQLETHDEQGAVSSLQGLSSGSPSNIGQTSPFLGGDASLAAFRKEFSANLDTSNVDAGTGTKAEVTPLESDLASNTVSKVSPFGKYAKHRKVSLPQTDPYVKHSKPQPARRGWLTDALAAWGKEQDSELTPSASPGAHMEAASDDDMHSDLGESGDLGESDDIGVTDSTDAMAATAEKALSSDVEAEAQKAADQVVKSTMGAVERDFLYTEKAITHQLSSKKAPKLTLDVLEKAGGRKKAKLQKQKAKKAYKEMVLKAKENYELAIANAHKQSQQQLANVLSGLKIKLRQKEDKLMAKAAIDKQKVKERMSANIRARTVLYLNKMKSMMPAKVAAAKAKAQVQAQRVASMAIQQITKGAKNVRMNLQHDLGEAADRVQGAEQKLAHADTNPTVALKDAVDVQTEKKKYQKLKKLAQVALVQQKSKAAHNILLAEENAKASVRLAVHDVEKKELKEAQGQLAASQNKLAKEEEKQAQRKMKLIQQMTDAKIKAERYKFKQLVDAAVKTAPSREKSLRIKAKISLQKAKVAAKAYVTQIRKSTRPKTASGKRITKKMAAECVKNPTGCKMFTLKGQNIAAAAKFAESQARKAKRQQLTAKEGVAKAMQKLNSATAVMQKMSKEAEDLDEKETRIRLAKLQLNEAKAAAAFHSAAKAHLQTELAHSKFQAGRKRVNDQLQKFQTAMKEMKLTSDEGTKNLARKAKVTKKAAFSKAAQAARKLLKPTLQSLS